MQSTPTQPPGPAPAPPSPAESLSDYLHKVQRAQSDALAIIHRVMIQAARLLEERPLEKPYQMRSTNERMRIAMRSAATIINMRIPRLPGEPPTPPAPAPSPSRSQLGRVDRAKPEEPEVTKCDPKDRFPCSLRLSEVGEGRCSCPPSPGSAGDRAFGSRAHESRKSPSDAQHPFTSPSEGRMRAPCSSPTPTAATTLTISAASNPLPQLSTHDAALKTPPPVPSLSTTPPLPLPPSSVPLSTSLSPLPSSLPSVPSLVTGLPPPPDLTFEERANIHMRQQGVKVPYIPTIAAKLRAWHLYTEKTGIKPPFDYTPESLLPPPQPRRRSGHPIMPPRPPPPAYQEATDAIAAGRAITGTLPHARPPRFCAAGTGNGIDLL